MNLREFNRCIAWALGLGAFALFFAMFTGIRLEQVDGAPAWLLLVAYLPFYAIVHVASPALPEPLLLALVFVSQFAYFVACVAAVRQVARRVSAPGRPLTPQ